MQATLEKVCEKSVREDFLSGKNGAIKLSEDEMKHLEELHREVEILNQVQEKVINFTQQAQKVAEHFISIVDGKQRDFSGTTYCKIRDIIYSIMQSGYFERNSINPELTDLEVFIKIIQIILNIYYKTKIY